MFVRQMAVVVSLVLSFAVSADQEPIDYSAVYGECNKAWQRGGLDEALTKCEVPARGGVPGAQYMVGALLTNRNRGNDMQRGIEWLENAVATGHPSAAYHLGALLAERKDQASVSRGHELFRMAVCAGQPQALEALADAGASRDAIRCPVSSETDFNGVWTIFLKWDKTAPAGAAIESYKVSVNGGRARVDIKVDQKWIEAKPGKFKVSQEGETLTVSVVDQGWDADGRWIESWTIQMMRTGLDEASVAYLRTVNNPHLPARFKWRTFSTFAEGSARRTAQ